MKIKVKKSVLSELFDYLKMIIFVVVFVLIMNNFIIVNALIPSESMEDTIMTGDRIFGNRLSYLVSEPERGDIIIFKYPDDEKQLFIKRVIGLPGDMVDIRIGKVYINNSEIPLDEPYLPESMIGGYGPYEVPEGNYFVMGDNRNRSKDSRLWDNKYVRKDQIEGKATFRYFPFNTMGTIK